MVYGVGSGTFQLVRQGTFGFVCLVFYNYILCVASSGCRFPFCRPRAGKWCNLLPFLRFWDIFCFFFLSRGKSGFLFIFRGPFISCCPWEFWYLGTFLHRLVGVHVRPVFCLCRRLTWIQWFSFRIPTNLVFHYGVCCVAGPVRREAFLSYELKG